MTTRYPYMSEHQGRTQRSDDEPRTLSVEYDVGYQPDDAEIPVVVEEPDCVDSKIAHGSRKSSPFRRALTEVWRVAQFGEQKHGANNWERAQPGGMYLYEDAMWRHWMARRMGRTHASDSQCYHLAHMAWNALMLLEMELRGVTSPEWDDGDEPCDQ